jgi:hypothetical protein
MKRQYDFSRGERGGFYRRGTQLRIPVYLDDKSAAFLRKVAAEKGTDVGDIVNDWIRRDIELIKSAT